MLEGALGGGRGGGPHGLQGLGSPSPWEAGVQAALGDAGRTVAVCTAPKSAPALSGFAGSASQRPVFLTARRGPHQTLAPGLRTLLPHAPQPGSRAPTPASALTPGDGPEGLRPPSDSALVLRVCVYTRERVHMCVRACEGSGAHV